jgi:hypothetical protein
MRYSCIRFFLSLLLFASSPLLLLSQSRPASTPKESKPVSTPKPALNNNPVSAPKPVSGAVNSSSPKPASYSESFSNPKPTNASTPVSSPKAVSRFNGESGVFIPVWEKEMQVSSPVNVQEMIKAPFFTGASFDREVVNLPYFDMLVPVGKGESLTIGSVQAEGVQEVSDETFKLAMQSATLQKDAAWYPNSHVVTGQVISIRGEEFQHVQIYPILVAAGGSSYKKASTINYSVSRKQDPARRTPDLNARQGYVNESVLRSGAFYKFGITSEGMYQLDHSFFSGLGVDPASIDPRTIKVYGNGGATLPQVAGLYPHDDLVENALLAQGAGDGSFDANDYVAFYTPGLGRWEDSDTVDRYIYFPNFYSDTAFYFVTWGGANGRRITAFPSAANPNFTPTYTTKFGHYEVDKDNTITSGRLWMGERFDLTTTQSFNFNLPNIVSGSNVLTSVRTGARSTGVGSKFTIREGGTAYAELTMNATSTVYGTTDYYCDNATFNIPSTKIADGQLNLELIYNKPTTSSVGYLDYIEYQFQQELNLAGQNYFYFTATDNVGPGQVFNYQLGGANPGYQIWDVTDPLNVRPIVSTLNGNTLTFAVEADSNKRFVAFNGSGFKRPSGAKLVPNQNLHALTQAEFLIVTHPDFWDDATRLADFHRSHYGQSVNVVRVGEIFNEFSSGAQDPTAIRDFAKMFYDRGQQGGTPLRYMLLFGDGSYDYKAIQTPVNTNFIPTYQSRGSQLPTRSYTSDDYYGFLDDGEGHWGEQAYNRDAEIIPLFWAEGDVALTDHGLDISVGRFPVANATESKAVVDKILAYHQDYTSYGPWRNRVLLTADHKDDDGNLHATQADGYTAQIQAGNPCANIDKIYMDNYVLENQASGDRFPDGKAALLKALDEGSLLVNYTGHGGEVGWSNAQILDISDINKIDNGNRLPAYVTATCEFGRWDDPNRKAGAEVLLVREGGGSVAMFTTVRVVFAGPNHTLNINYYNEVFKYDTLNQRMPTMGEVFMRTKNVSWGGQVNNRNFSLLGDPAMTLAYPHNKAVVTKINGNAVIGNVTDTLSALNLITIEGEARDQQDNLMTTYNGDLFVTVYDKPSKFTTRRRPFDFIWQRNKVFKGSATIQNGLFAFEFVVPIDISYEDLLSNLNGKISMYYNNTTSDGGGCNDDIFIGGSDSAAISDNRPPEMDLFMNDIKFADGGMVGPDPILIAEIFDENGINTVGTGIGHELTGILDNDESEVLVLNDYYEANQNSYQDGTIRYPFKDLEPGEHNLRVKVWDVANNSREGEINFIVADDATMALGHVLNYPNPFSTNTKFFIEHNRNGNALMVQVKVYSVSGKLVKTLQDNFFAEGNLYCDLEWDGLDDYGDAIGRGVYVYEVVVKDETTGDRISKFEKLVLLR